MSVSYSSNSRQGSFTSGGVVGAVPGVTADLPNIGGSLGGGIRGIMPRPIGKVDKTYENYEQVRISLKRAWNNTSYNKTPGGATTYICTPFRAVNNAGDIFSRLNYSCGGPCQSFQSRPNMHGLRRYFGAISSSSCDETGIPPAACNVRYVYDSSDYIRYKKQLAVNKNYNDVSYAGNIYKASQSAIRASRRY